jgi:hypothetical protein
VGAAAQGSSPSGPTIERMAQPSRSRSCASKMAASRVSMRRDSVSRLVCTSRYRTNHSAMGVSGLILGSGRCKMCSNAVAWAIVRPCDYSGATKIERGHRLVEARTPPASKLNGCALGSISPPGHKRSHFAIAPHRQRTHVCSIDGIAFGRHRPRDNACFRKRGCARSRPGRVEGERG